MDMQKIISLRMERQFFTEKADEEEYIKLYRDTQPGVNVYWNGFGQPPTLSFRANFDDLEFNRRRLLDRRLIKGRFSGGNIGWIIPEDLELFGAVYRKPLTNPTEAQMRLYGLIRREGPFNIQGLKSETGMLVKEITPILHRLQEAFLIYEDQNDGEWDRGWYKFEEMFPDADFSRYTRHEAIKILLKRFGYRQVLFNTKQAKEFYKIPEKEIKAAIAELISEGIFVEAEGGFMLQKDADSIEKYKPKKLNLVYAMHRNDFLVKSDYHILKDKFKYLYEKLEYDHEPIQYLLIDGEFRGAVVGHFHNGPYDLNDVVCELDGLKDRKTEIIRAVADANFGALPLRFMGEKI